MLKLDGGSLTRENEVAEESLSFFAIFYFCVFFGLELWPKTIDF